MLVTMLRSAGHETYAAMTMAGSRVEEIPADQFNHCVVALRQEDGDYLMLDPTWAPWNNPIWSRWEGEQFYVIGSPEGEELMMIPPFAPEDNLLSVESEASISVDGSLEGTLRLEGRGISDGRLRGAVGNRAKRDVRHYLEGWLGLISERAELKEFLFSDHEDFTRDTTLRLVYRIPHFAEAWEEDLVFRSPALSLVAESGALSRLALVPEGEEREHDLFMWAPQQILIDESLDLPRGYEAEAPEAVDEDEAAASLRLDWEAKGRKLDLSADLQLLGRLTPAGDFPGLRGVVDAIEEAAEGPIIAVK
jgi:hypothetical protein